jgi:hypothetical protein
VTWRHNQHSNEIIVDTSSEESDSADKRKEFETPEFGKKNRREQKKFKKRDSFADKEEVLIQGHPIKKRKVRGIQVENTTFWHDNKALNPNTYTCTVNACRGTIVRDRDRYFRVIPCTHSKNQQKS